MDLAEEIEATTKKPTVFQKNGTLKLEYLIKFMALDKVIDNGSPHIHKFRYEHITCITLVYTYIYIYKYIFISIFKIRR